MSDAEPSYIDYEAFLDPAFSPIAFANSLVVSTNNPSDTPLDLSTPLSRVLFDVQEIDTHIHTLTTKSALPLLEHTRDQTQSSQHILDDVEAQVAVLSTGYQRLEKEVVQRWERAEEVRVATENSWRTIKIGRAVARCLALGRQLEAQMGEMGGTGRGSKEDHRAMIRASGTLLMIRPLLSATKESQEGYGLERIKVIKTLRADLITPSENHIRARASQIVREFSMSTLSSTTATTAQQTPSTFAQTEDAKSRAISAVTVLYLLSPVGTAKSSSEFHPELLLVALQSYFQTAITSSLASLSRALSTLPTLERTLIEVSARCQNIVALEALLASIRVPLHPLLQEPGTAGEEQPAESTTLASAPISKTMLQPLLQSFDTSSLPSYFWRSLASSLSSRVQEILNRGGVSARTLRTNKERVKEEIRGCVMRGSQLPVSSLSKGRTTAVGNWEREAAVMVGAVIGVLGR